MAKIDFLQNPRYRALVEQLGDLTQELIERERNPYFLIARRMHEQGWREWWQGDSSSYRRGPEGADYVEARNAALATVGDHPLPPNPGTGLEYAVTNFLSILTQESGDAMYPQNTGS